MGTLDRVGICVSPLLVYGGVTKCQAPAKERKLHHKRFMEIWAPLYGVGVSDIIVGDKKRKKPDFLHR